MAQLRQSRRRFIGQIILWLGGLGLLRRYLTPESLPADDALLRVPAADVPLRGALVYREERLALVRGEEGIYALSLICTHLGCTVTVGAAHLTCPCHGSEFERSGAVLKGPAQRPLRRHTVREREGMVEVMRL